MLFVVIESEGGDSDDEREFVRRVTIDCDVFLRGGVMPPDTARMRLGVRLQLVRVQRISRAWPRGHMWEKVPRQVKILRVQLVVASY